MLVYQRVYHIDPRPRHVSGEDFLEGKTQGVQNDDRRRQLASKTETNGDARRGPGGPANRENSVANKPWRYGPSYTSYPLVN